MNMEVVVNIVLAVLLLGMTYALSSEGAWGAALMFFNVLFAGLIAFNFYEPLAAFLGQYLSSYWVDMLSLFFLFFLSLVILRVITDMYAPSMVRLPTPVYQIGRLIFGAGTACLTLAILLCVLETAPVEKKAFGALDYEAKSLWGLGLDRKWLAFVQYTSGNIFPTYSEDNPLDPLGEFGRANVFDPKGIWMINHQNARPYEIEGESNAVPPEEVAPAAAAAPAPTQ